MTTGGVRMTIALAALGMLAITANSQARGTSSRSPAARSATAAPEQANASRMAEVRAFNQQFTAAHLRMDNAAIEAMWAEDGVSLLPGMDAVRGRAAIAQMIESVVAKMPGYKVVRQEDDFQDIEVAGDWASEWATTHQVVQPPDGKPAIEVRGKMLLVLHREPGGQWKIEREMWNSAPK